MKREDYNHWHIGLVSRVFANGLWDQGSIPETQKMILDTSLLNTQHYKVQIKGKVEQSKDRTSTLPLHLRAVAIEKGAFGSLLGCSWLSSRTYKLIKFLYSLSGCRKTLTELRKEWRAYAFFFYRSYLALLFSSCLQVSKKKWKSSPFLVRAENFSASIKYTYLLLFTITYKE